MKAGFGSWSMVQQSFVNVWPEGVADSVETTWMKSPSVPSMVDLYVPSKGAPDTMQIKITSQDVDK